MTPGIELLSPLNKISPTYSAHSWINCIELYSIESLKIVLTMMSASHRIVQYLYFLEMYESSFFKHDEFFIEWMDCLKMLHGFINKWMIYLKLMDGFLHGWINLSNYQNLSFEWLVTSHSHSPTSALASTSTSASEVNISFFKLGSRNFARWRIWGMVIGRGL